MVAKPQHVVCVTWHDAHCDNNTWTAIDDIDTDPCVVRTVGYLLVDRKPNHVVIAQSFIDIDEPDVDAVLSIPLGMVKSIVVMSPMSESTSERASR